jgi:hypothetical protein
MMRRMAERMVCHGRGGAVTQELVVRRAQPRHIRYVTARMRRQDAREARAMTGLSVAGAVLASVRASDDVWVVMHRKTRQAEGADAGHGPVFRCRPVAVFGIAGLAEVDGVRAGMPWLVATAQAGACSRGILRHALCWLEAFHRRYPLLVNAVDSQNRTAGRWMRRTGFRQTQLHGGLLPPACRWIAFIRHSGREDICA